MDKTDSIRQCAPLDAGSAPLPDKITLIGCNGRMGRMLAEKARELGIPLAGVDLPFAKADLDKALAKTDVAILCVPARNFEETLEKVIPHLPEKAILADITSVKEKPMRLMEEIWPGKVIGTHPLFGPNFKEGDDLPVALTPGKNCAEEDLKKVGKFFACFGCRLFTCSASYHDQAMARIQNMNFITNLAYFAAMANQEDLLPFLTPSFERRKKAAAKMLTEDADMFSGLFEENYYSHEAVRQYRKMLNVAASGDIDLLLRKAGWWWREDRASGKK